jgi:hypothetical protein
MLPENLICFCSSCKRYYPLCKMAPKFCSPFLFSFCSCCCRVSKYLYLLVPDLHILITFWVVNQYQYQYQHWLLYLFYQCIPIRYRYDSLDNSVAYEEETIQCSHYKGFGHTIHVYWLCYYHHGVFHILLSISGPPNNP